MELVCVRDGNGQDAVAIPMKPVKGADGLTFEAPFDVPESGRFSYGVRARPHHDDMPNPFATHLVTWA
jgi:hypothetical protein